MSPTPQIHHGDTRLDNYAWLRDDERRSLEVLAHLETENAHALAEMEPVVPLQERIFGEIRTRTRETDLSVPYRYKDYHYYSRTEEGRQYPIYCRRAGSMEAAEEIYLDQNELAEGHDYFQIGAIEVSPDNRLVAYSTDADGSETYTLFVKDLGTGQLLPDRLENVAAVEWATDGAHLFYTVRDASKRAHRLYRHRLGEPASADSLIYQEDDALFEVSVFRTRSDAYIVFGSESSTSTEYRFVPADRPSGPARLIAPREKEVEYYVEHRGDLFYIRTNLGARNFRVVTAPVASPGRESWTEFLPHRPEVKLEDLDVFAGHWVTSERVKGLPQIRVTDFDTGQSHNVDFPDPTYAVFPTNNVNFETTAFRFNYQSLVTPPSVFDHDVETRERKLLKQIEVLGGYDPGEYVTERIFARASDDAEVPISIVYRRGVRLDGTAPLVMYGYGAYGINSEPRFAIPRLSLLDRGVIFAIAHVRGGGEMGEEWHDLGRMMHKRNTFTDFISCAEHLVAHRYTSPARLAITGGSAGGLLVGAVLNMRPDLFCCAVADVPFVDVMNTMLDSSLPLTVGEYLEWGNPHEAQAYFYMRTYCPYTNVSAQRYPAILATAGLNDPRVGYWEAAKWVARLRAMKLDGNPLILKVNLGAGHAGASGRYDTWKEIAFRYAFILTTLGIAD